MKVPSGPIVINTGRSNSWRSLHILSAEGGRHVHQAGAVFGGHVIFHYHVVSRLVGRQESEQRLVAFALQLLALERLQTFTGSSPNTAPAAAEPGSGAHCRRRAGSCSTVTYSTSGWAATATLPGSVQGVVVHTSREVPGSSTSGMRTKTDGSIRLVIPQGHLMVGERRSAARAVGHHFISLVEQVPCPKKSLRSTTPIRYTRSYK